MVNIIDKVISFNNTFVGAVPLPYYYYINYYLPTHIFELNCTGIENNIWDCPYDDSYHYCGRYQDAAVLCQCKYCYSTSKL